MRGAKRYQESGRRTDRGARSATARIRLCCPVFIRDGGARANLDKDSKTRENRHSSAKCEDQDMLANIVNS